MSILEDGFLEHEDKYSLFRLYLEHIDTVSYFTSDKTRSDFKMIALHFIGQGVVLGSLQFSQETDMKDQLQGWVIERAQSARAKRNASSVLPSSL